ncbi:MAG: signal peptidase II [Termitinemataceae bacterium]|nr:MAG: signal peptidase II [Termitinemataceae bacterium]
MTVLCYNSGMFFLIKKAAPLILTLFIICADQISKSYITRNWPVKEGGFVFISDVFNNDILQIVHVRNKAIAFSIGNGLPELAKRALFIVLPLLILVLIAVYFFRSNQWTTKQRWALAGIIGGGAGNMIDRIYPHGGIEGVVDFISVKFWGLFGFERWPTFNIADASVVICVIFLLITMMLPSKTRKS